MSMMMNGNVVVIFIACNLLSLMLTPSPFYFLIVPPN
ncbi:hypothetical protein F383_09555 [Gossypium arboreum]|uniref:Uncharacterized protein n=1 Tax=Gossypium arboreum TaxID=29729 RepID=A0A0B0PJJ6_GOSAR|nr:hypothetical protein F383_09555 [Gossypium arboreum]